MRVGLGEWWHTLGKWGFAVKMIKGENNLVGSAAITFRPPQEVSESGLMLTSFHVEDKSIHKSTQIFLVKPG